MPKTDPYEAEVQSAFERGAPKSVATRAELAKFAAQKTSHCGGRSTRPRARDCTRLAASSTSIEHFQTERGARRKPPNAEARP